MISHKKTHMILLGSLLILLLMTAASVTAEREEDEVTIQILSLDDLYDGAVDDDANEPVLIAPSPADDLTIQITGADGTETTLDSTEAGFSLAVAGGFAVAALTLVVLLGAVAVGYKKH